MPTRYILERLTMLVLLLASSGCRVAAPDQSLALPAHFRSDCEQPTARELKILQSAADAIALDDAPISNFMTIGAQKLLGYGLLRAGAKSSQRVCTPESILSQVGASMVAPKGLGAGQLVEYQLRLAAQLPNPSDFVIEQVGKAAFNSSKQHSEIFPRQDIRPMARSTLASFGKRAAEFKDAAKAEMAGDSSMGTGAAQVAAAVGEPQAVSQIIKLFEETLGSVQGDAVIPIDKRDRLLELAWAMYFAGDAGRPSCASIHKVMHRKVESRAPPFGIVAISPKRFCSVLEIIEGSAGIAPYAYCHDKSIPYEQ